MQVFGFDFVVCFLFKHFPISGQEHPGPRVWDISGIPEGICSVGLPLGHLGEEGEKPSSSQWKGWNWGVFKVLPNPHQSGTLGSLFSGNLEWEKGGAGK